MPRIAEKSILCSPCFTFYSICAKVFSPGDPPKGTGEERTAPPTGVRPLAPCGSTVKSKTMNNERAGFIIRWYKCFKTILRNTVSSVVSQQKRKVANPDKETERERGGGAGRGGEESLQDLKLQFHGWPAGVAKVDV